MKHYVVITRPARESKDLIEQLNTLGIPVFSYPTISVAENPLGKKMITAKLLNSADWIVFTSVNGVRHFMETLNALTIGMKNIADKHIATVGPKTAEEARRHGLNVDFVPSRFTTAQLGKELPDVTEKTILIPRSAIANKSLNTALERKGATVIDIPIYKTRYISKNRSKLQELLSEGQIKCITFTSPSTVLGFMKSLKPQQREKVLGVPILSIGPVTTRAARTVGFHKIITAKTYTTEGMMLQLQEL